MARKVYNTPQVELPKPTGLAFRGPSDAADELEQRRFSGAIRADDTEAAASLDLEIDVLQCPVLSMMRTPSEELEHPSTVVLVDAEALAHAASRHNPGVVLRLFGGMVRMHQHLVRRLIVGFEGHSLCLAWDSIVPPSTIRC